MKRGQGLDDGQEVVVCARHQGRSDETSNKGTLTRDSILSYVSATDDDRLSDARRRGPRMMLNFSSNSSQKRLGRMLRAPLAWLPARWLRRVARLT